MNKLALKKETVNELFHGELILPTHYGATPYDLGKTIPLKINPEVQQEFERVLLEKLPEGALDIKELRKTFEKRDENPKERVKMFRAASKKLNNSHRIVKQRKIVIEYIVASLDIGLGLDKGDKQSLARWYSNNSNSCSFSRF